MNNKYSNGYPRNSLAVFQNRDIHFDKLKMDKMKERLKVENEKVH